MAAIMIIIARSSYFGERRPQTNAWLDSLAHLRLAGKPLS